MSRKGAEIHEMAMDNAVMTMRALPDGVEIKPGETLTFKPGGLHLMLMGLKKPLVQGTDVHVTLNFAKAGRDRRDLAGRQPRRDGASGAGRRFAVDQLLSA